MRHGRAPFVASQAAHTHCLDLVKRYDNENFVINLLLPKAVRHAHAALRALNVELTQVRTKTKNEDMGRARMLWYRTACEEITQGIPPPRTPVLDALAQACAQHPTIANDVLALVEARESELAYPDVRTAEAFVNAARSTHGNLTAATMHILNPDAGARAREAALATGTAIGIAVALRSVPYHAASRLSYMPADIVSKHSASREEMLAGGPNASSVFEAVAMLAKEQIKSARRDASGLTRSAKPALWGIRIADIYLNRLASAQYNVFDHRLQAGMRATYPLRLQWSLLVARITARV